MKFLCKNLYFLVVFSILLTTCYAYGYEPVRSTINKDKKIVWDESLDFLILNGFKIITINYDSGLIYAEKNMGGKNLGWDIKNKKLVSNGYLTCQKPTISFADAFKGKVKFTLLNSDGYFTIRLKTIDHSTEIILYIDGSSQWGPVVGMTNPVISSCESNDSLEEYFISYLNGDKDVFFIDRHRRDKAAYASEHIARLDSSDFNQIRTAAKDIFTNGGVSNLEIYEKLDKILKDNYKKTDNDSIATDTLAWICKSLSTSSDPKYKVTLKEVAENASDRKVRRHAEWALSQ